MLMRLKLYAAGVAVFVLGLFGIYLSGRRAGADAVKAAINEARFDDLERAKHVEDRINALSDDALRELGARWVRKGE
jgi:hypothetical protein